MSQAFPAFVTDATPLRTVRDLLSRIWGYLAPNPADDTPQEASSKREAARREAGTELARLAAERDVELPTLAAAEERTRLQLERLTPGYQQALADFDRARIAHRRRAHDYAYAEQLQVRRVEAAAEPIIEETAHGFLDLMEANRKTPIEEDERNPVWDVEGNRYVFETWSNVPSIEARRAAIMSARAAAEAMKADPDQTDIQARLAALVENLPDPSVLVKVADPQFRQPTRNETGREQRERLTGIPYPDNVETRRADAMRRGSRRVA